MPSFTRKDQKLADKVIASRPGNTIAEKTKNAIKDASRKRGNPVSTQKFLDQKNKRDLDIKGFDDGKDSKLYLHEKNNMHEKMKRLREIKAEKRKKLDKEARKQSTKPRRYKVLKKKMEMAATSGKLLTSEERQEYAQITPYDVLTQKPVGSKKR